MTSKLSKRDLNRVFVRYIALNCMNDYPGQMHSGFTFSMLPSLEKIYAEHPEKLNESVMRHHAEYFNITPSLAGFPLGITLAMEEENAKSEDFDTEFLDYILAVKLVPSLEEAVEHIETHSTHHSDAIVTENDAAAAYFTEQVDSAAVYVNASTRFTDGGQFGLGCEMGISTQKLHARGPMGLKELTSYKYVIQGTGQVRK